MGGNANIWTTLIMLAQCTLLCYTLPAALILFNTPSVAGFGPLSFAQKTATKTKRQSTICNVHRAIHDDDSQYFESQAPLPQMPSRQFFRMARAQLELLANSLIQRDKLASKKIQSMGLYLPQENLKTGQLEFTPAVLHPDPSSERVFIASDADSGLAPKLPQALTKLPGFETATSLLPGYPMISTDDTSPTVGVVEEVMCDPTAKHTAAALSVPLLSGSQTVGVLLVSPSRAELEDRPFWTEQDREQISIAAQSLSIGLSMDSERSFLQTQNKQIQQSLSDSLHQVKNPLQALRTYGKLLERRISTDGKGGSNIPNLMDLTNSLMVQSDRIVDLLQPIDLIVEQMEYPSPRYLLSPGKNGTDVSALALWQETDSTLFDTIENETLEYARVNSTMLDNVVDVPNRQGQRGPKSAGVSMSTAVTDVDGSNDHDRQMSSSPDLKMFSDDELGMTFLDDLLEPILSAFRAVSLELGISFEVVQEVAELPGVFAAPKALQEALCNLLDNALKYVTVPKEGSPFSYNPKPKVIVRIMPNESTMDPGVSILVEDNGPGIPKGDRLRVFQRGYRGQATDSVNGSGIGLPIAQSFINHMGGSITVEDPTEVGSSLDGNVMKLVLYRSPSKNR